MVVISVYHVGTFKKMSKNRFKYIGNFIFCNHLLPSQKMMYVFNGSIQSISIQAPSNSTVHFLLSQQNAQQWFARKYRKEINFNVWLP